MKTQLGEVDVNVPCDRNGEFEPQIIGKYQRNADGIEERILSLYATGMSTRDIKNQIKGLYDVEISEGLVSKISERILPEVTEWQNRPLEAFYPFIFMDAIHYKIREDHQLVTKAAYVVLGINNEGMKEVLGLWVGASESTKYWMGVHNYKWLHLYSKCNFVYQLHLECKYLVVLKAYRCNRSHEQFDYDESLHFSKK